MSSSLPSFPPSLRVTSSLQPALLPRGAEAFQTSVYTGGASQEHSTSPYAVPRFLDPKPVVFKASGAWLHYTSNNQNLLLTLIISWDDGLVLYGFHALSVSLVRLGPGHFLGRGIGGRWKGFALRPMLVWGWRRLTRSQARQTPKAANLIEIRKGME